jgi:hypothetical protein
MSNKAVVGNVPRGLTPELSRFLQDMREQVQIQGGKGRGNSLDRAITYRDLKKDVGTTSLKGFKSIIASQSTGNAELYGDAFPNAPTGVEVLPTFTNVLVKWDRVPNTWYKLTEVFRVTALLNIDDPDNPYPYLEGGRVPLFSDAVQIASTISPFFADDLPPGSTAVYWVRHLNRDEQAGPLHNVAGTWGTTRRTPLEVLTEYSAEIYQTDAYAWLRSELGEVDAINRAMVGAGFESSMANLLANGASIDDLLAEQSIAAALDKHTQRSEIKAQFGKNYARLSGGIHAAVNADEAYVQRISALESQWVNDLGDAIDAKVDTFESALTSPTGAIATKVTELGTSVGLTTSGIADSLVTMANTDVALADRSTALEAVIDVDGESVSSQIETLESSIVDAETGAIASQISNLTVSYDGNDVSLTKLAETVATNDTNHARWGVKTDVNGKRGGVAFNNDGEMTSFLIDADTFAITDGNTELAPFVVKDGQVVMKKALIDHADIFTLIADNVTAKTIDATVSLTSPVIDGGSISGTTLDISGTEGKSMSVNAQGFLEAEGAEFKSITIKDATGDVIMSSSGLADTYIETLMGEDATFSGTVYANNIEGDVMDAVLKTSTVTNSGDTGVFGQACLTFALTALPFPRTIYVPAIAVSVHNPGRIMFNNSFAMVLRRAIPANGPLLYSEVARSYEKTGRDLESAETTGNFTAVGYELPANAEGYFELGIIRATGTKGTATTLVQDIVIQAFKKGSSLS